MVLLEAFGAHFHPPGEEVGLPLFEGALEAAVVGEVDIIRDKLAVVDLRCFGSWGVLWCESEGGFVLMSRKLDAAEVELWAFGSSETLERAVFADSVRALEDPVLPGGEAAKDFSFDGFGASEAEAGLHACERVWRKEARSSIKTRISFSQSMSSRAAVIVGGRRLQRQQTWGWLLKFWTVFWHRHRSA